MKYYFSLVILLLTVHTNASCQDKVTDSLSRVTKQANQPKRWKPGTPWPTRWFTIIPIRPNNTPGRPYNWHFEMTGQVYPTLIRALVSHSTSAACDMTAPFIITRDPWPSAIKIDNLKGRGSALNNLGLIYWNLGLWQRPLPISLMPWKTLKASEMTNTANALNNIDLVWWYQ